MQMQFPSPPHLSQYELETPCSGRDKSSKWTNMFPGVEDVPGCIVTVYAIMHNGSSIQLVRDLVQQSVSPVSLDKDWLLEVRRLSIAANTRDGS